MITPRFRNLTEPWLKRSFFAESENNSLPKFPDMFRKLKPSLFLIVCLALCINVSCQKEDKPNQRMSHTEVKGRLLDASTGEPIEGGTVYLTYGVSWIVLDSVTSSADGSYSFSYDHDSIPVADVWAKAPKYLSNENIGTWAANYPNGGASGRGAVKHNGEVNHLDIRLPPMGYVKYHFKQVESYPGEIEVRFTPYDSFSVVSWNGQGLNNTYTSVFPGGTAYRIGYAILRDGKLDEQRYDSLFIPRFDTLNYYVEF